MEQGYSDWAGLAERQRALLERVTVLERALEKIDMVARDGRIRKRDPDSALTAVGVITTKALDG